MTAPCEFHHNYAEVGEVMLHYVTTAPEGPGQLKAQATRAPVGGPAVSSGPEGPSKGPQSKAQAGKPPVVLLHGWPQTWYEWRHIMPALSQHYTVIAPDLRGLGDSSRPLTGYDKRTVANDVWRLVTEKLGHTSFHLVGHDWGGPTAFALASQHPEAIATLTIIDVVIPGDGGEFSEGGRRWHHQFHITPDLPEALVQGRERLYLQWFYQTFCYKPGAIPDADLDEYVRTYSQPGALRSGFNFYRALAQDAKDNAAWLATGARLHMPVLGIAGGVSYPHGRGRGATVEMSLKNVATNVKAVVLPECGHFVPEEQPAAVAKLLLEHFGTAPVVRPTRRDRSVPDGS